MKLTTSAAFLLLAPLVKYVISAPAGPDISIISEAEYIDIQHKTQYAHLAYCANQESFVQYTCNICEPTKIPLEKRTRIASDDNQFQGYVGVDPASKSIIFAFQGAVNPSNWAYAVQFPRTNFALPVSTSTGQKTLAASGAGVHDGFFASYMMFRNNIVGNITQYIQQYPDYELQGAGHSYGAILITFTAVDLVLNGVIPGSKVSLTTFGSPRVGNFEFAKLVDEGLGLKSNRRIVHSTDAIVKYPPTPSGYRHTGVEYWLDVDTKQIYICRDVPAANTRGAYDESPSCSNGVPFRQLGANAHNSYFDTTQKTACPAASVDNPLTVKYLQYQIYDTRP
ncbi:hypothetical protein HDV05_004343 [Chytridiales sp. JEL 0842]|nr:hypothetical protein HDV05_004343 [Chytridiales sp. JEL 0842]